MFTKFNIFKRKQKPKKEINVRSAEFSLGDLVKLKKPDNDDIENLMNEYFSDTLFIITDIPPILFGTQKPYAGLTFYDKFPLRYNNVNFEDIRHLTEEEKDEVEMKNNADKYNL